jgi:hypothetical protein
MGITAFAVFVIEPFLRAGEDIANAECCPVFTRSAFNKDEAVYSKR